MCSLLRVVEKKMINVHYALGMKIVSHKLISSESKICIG